MFIGNTSGKESLEYSLDFPMLLNLGYIENIRRIVKTKDLKLVEVTFTAIANQNNSSEDLASILYNAFDSDSSLEYFTEVCKLFLEKGLIKTKEQKSEIFTYCFIRAINLQCNSVALHLAINFKINVKNKESLINVYKYSITSAFDEWLQNDSKTIEYMLEKICKAMVRNNIHLTIDQLKQMINLTFPKNLLGSPQQKNREINIWNFLLIFKNFKGKIFDDCDFKPFLHHIYQKAISLEYILLISQLFEHFDSYLNFDAFKILAIAAKHELPVILGFVNKFPLECREARYGCAFHEAIKAKNKEVRDFLNVSLFMHDSFFCYPFYSLKEYASQTDLNGKTILHYAVESRDLNFVKVLLRYYPFLKGSKDNRGRTALTLATELNLNKIERCLQNTKSEPSKSPLHAAIDQKNLQEVEKLLSKNPLYNRVDLEALILATVENDINIFKVAVKYFFPNFELDPRDTLFYKKCISNGDLARLKFLHENTKITGNLIFSIELAAAFGQVEILNFLFSIKSLSSENSDSLKSQWGLALHYAASMGHLDAIKWMLSKSPSSTHSKLIEAKGIDVTEQINKLSQEQENKIIQEHKSALIVKANNIVRFEDHTVLHCAARYGHKEIASYLAQIAPNALSLKNDNNETPALFAKRHNQVPTQMVLIAAFVDHSNAKKAAIVTPPQSREAQLACKPLPETQSKPIKQVIPAKRTKRHAQAVINKASNASFSAAPPSPGPVSVNLNGFNPPPNESREGVGEEVLMPRDYKPMQALLPLHQEALEPQIHLVPKEIGISSLSQKVEKLSLQVPAKLDESKSERKDSIRLSDCQADQSREEGNQIRIKRNLKVLDRKPSLRHLVSTIEENPVPEKEKKKSKFSKLANNFLPSKSRKKTHETMPVFDSTEANERLIFSERSGVTRSHQGVLENYGRRKAHQKDALEKSRETKSCQLSEDSSCESSFEVIEAKLIDIQIPFKMLEHDLKSCTTGNFDDLKLSENTFIQTLLEMYQRKSIGLRKSKAKNHYHANHINNHKVAYTLHAHGHGWNTDIVKIKSWVRFICNCDQDIKKMFLRAGFSIDKLERRDLHQESSSRSKG